MFCDDDSTLAFLEKISHLKSLKTLRLILKSNSLSNNCLEKMKILFKDNFVSLLSLDLQVKHQFKLKKDAKFFKR